MGGLSKRYLALTGMTLTLGEWRHIGATASRVCLAPVWQQK